MEIVWIFILLSLFESEIKSAEKKGLIGSSLKGKDKRNAPKSSDFDLTKAIQFDLEHFAWRDAEIHFLYFAYLKNF